MGIVKRLFFLAALGLGACGTTSGAGGGEVAPFSGDDLGGHHVDLARHLGKDVVLVSFWATYCEPCKAEMPYLQRFHDQYAARGLTIVSVAIDGPETEAEVAPYIRKQGYTFPVVIDRDGAITQALNPTATAPYAIVVARSGKIWKRISGFQPSEAEALEHELVALLDAAAAPSPAPATTP